MDRKISVEDNYFAKVPDKKSKTNIGASNDNRVSQAVVESNNSFIESQYDENENPDTEFTKGKGVINHKSSTSGLEDLQFNDQDVSGHFAGLPNQELLDHYGNPQTQIKPLRVSAAGGDQSIKRKQYTSSQE